MSIQWQVPHILKYDDVPQLFADFFELNKSKTRGFSHRYFAQKAKWPMSYLSDLIKGRKPLTLTRAVQFSQLVRLDSLQTERLIYLTLLKAKEIEIQKFAKKKISATIEGLYHKTCKVPYSMIENLEYEAVMTVLVWARKKIPAQEIKKRLFTFEDFSEEKINAVIKKLEEHKVISFDQKGHLKDFSFMVLDESRDDPTQSAKAFSTGVHIHKKYAENFIQFAKKDLAPSFYTSGFVEIPRKDFKRIAEKFYELRNWVLEFGQQTSLQKKESVEDTVVFQMTMNLFTLLEL
ncbi:MAG: hypothetical protein ACOYOK_06610 [Pseudobdellovibrionaceae bacterium]